MTLVLGIETSCDETAAAIVENGLAVRSSVVLTQIDLHEKFGGVVPEIACRAHVENVTLVVERALKEAGVVEKQIDAVAVTNTPGLIGSLLVGVAAAKALAVVWEKPLVAVNHVEAHLFSPRLSGGGPDYPFIGLVVSGGHTALYRAESETESTRLGSTTDDAAGEAFDKVSAILGLGYPGGPAIAKAAENGDPRSVRFPRSMLGKESLDFSFSGIKTAVLYHVKGQDGKRNAIKNDINVADVAASFQEAVVDVLAAKLLRAAERTGVPRLAVSGGVSANRRLREKLAEAARKEGMEVAWPPVEYATDNAAMVAGLGYFLLAKGIIADLSLDAAP